jgi:hypothetical protein
MLEIRNAVLNDLDALTAVFVACFNDAPWNDGWSFAAARERLEAILEARHFRGAVATANGEVIGLVLGQKERWIEAFHSAAFYSAHGYGSAKIEGDNVSGADTGGASTSGSGIGGVAAIGGAGGTVSPGSGGAAGTESGGTSMCLLGVTPQCQSCIEQYCHPGSCAPAAPAARRAPSVK